MFSLVSVHLFLADQIKSGHMMDMRHIPAVKKKSKTDVLSTPSSQISVLVL